MRARTIFIMQYEVNPRTGESLNFTEANIKDGLNHRSIVRYAYIKHDKDVYTPEDEESNKKTLAAEYDRLAPEEKEKYVSQEDYILAKQWVHANDKKPVHWHVACECSRAVELSSIASWFGIKEQYIDVPKGRGAFLDCVEYETHEDEKQQKLGKHKYEDSEVVSNFDWRKELDTRAERMAKYGMDLSPKQALRHKVLYEGMTIREVEEQYPTEYTEDATTLDKFRGKYLCERAPMPAFRISYYIDGPGGIGKNVASKALARSLFPDVPDDRLYFEVGGGNVAFDGYDGQPVVIWNDRRAAGFIGTFGREETFDIFDPHPTNARHNVKFGSIRLVNAINIVNGVEPFNDFFDGISGEYTDRYGKDHEAEDKGQILRRIPIILCLHEEDFDVLINKGVAYGTREYQDYIAYKGVEGSFKQLAQRLEGKARAKVEMSMMQPALTATAIVQSRETKKIDDPNNIPADFADYGKQKQPKQPSIDNLPFE